MLCDDQTTVASKPPGCRQTFSLRSGTETFLGEGCRCCRPDGWTAAFDKTLDRSTTVSSGAALPLYSCNSLALGDRRVRAAAGAVGGDHHFLSPEATYPGSVGDC